MMDIQSIPVEKWCNLKYNSNAMVKIDKVNDKIFKKVFDDPENVRILLKKALPEPLLKAIDFSELAIDPTNYVSNKFKECFTDIVAKTKMKTDDKDGKTIDTDIYILIEHKCYRDEAIFIQLLMYMYLMWQKDLDDKKPLRVIIPLVFYHGKEKWTVPQSFTDQFNVSEDVKRFLLDFRYVLFDTVNWNFKDETNEELRENVFLMTALALMKSAFNEDIDAVRDIFTFWHEKGFTREEDNILFFLMYLTETKDIKPEKLKKMLEESKIPGGDFMPTLAERWKKEGMEKGIEKGMQKGMKEGMKAGKLETARELLKNGVSIDIIAKSTGFSKKELEKLIGKGH
jgi:predicted transposase/invertase (TIGR01784 family)